MYPPLVRCKLGWLKIWGTSCIGIESNHKVYHLLRYKWILSERTTNVRYWPYKMSEFTIWIRSWILSASNSRLSTKAALTSQSNFILCQIFGKFLGDYNIPVILASLTSGSLVPDPPTPTAIDGGSSPRLLSSLLSAQGHIHVISNGGVLQFLSNIFLNWVYTGCLIGILIIVYHNPHTTG